MDFNCRSRTVDSSQCLVSVSIADQLQITVNDHRVHNFRNQVITHRMLTQIGFSYSELISLFKCFPVKDKAWCNIEAVLPVIMAAQHYFGAVGSGHVEVGHTMPAVIYHALKLQCNGLNRSGIQAVLKDLFNGKKLGGQSHVLHISFMIGGFKTGFAGNCNCRSCCRCLTVGGTHRVRVCLKGIAALRCFSRSL